MRFEKRQTIYSIALPFVPGCVVSIGRHRAQTTPNKPSMAFDKNNCEFLNSYRNVSIEGDEIRYLSVSNSSSVKLFLCLYGCQKHCENEESLRYVVIKIMMIYDQLFFSSLTSQMVNKNSWVLLLLDFFASFVCLFPSSFVFGLVSLAFLPSPTFLINATFYQRQLKAHYTPCITHHQLFPLISLSSE